MAVNLVIAGQTYLFPTVGEDNWGENVTNWATAVSTQLLQRTGGTFTLTNDVNFGASFGLIVAYLKSRTANISTAGIVRLARTDSIGWRNAANNANLLLTVDASDNLTYNGTVLLASVGALTASKALVTNSGGDITTSATSAAQIAFLSAVASAVSGNADSATYTNKLLSDSTVLFANVSDSTKRLQFALGGLTASATRVVTWPDSDLTVVGLSQTQTLSNKTLTTPLANGLRHSITTASGATYVALTTDYYINAAAGTTTAITLPTAAAGNAGLTYVIKKTDANFTAITVSDGTFSTTLNTQNESIEVYSTGSAWVLERRNIPTDPVAYTPVSTWVSNATHTGFWSRSGKNLNCQIYVTLTGLPTSAVLNVGIPSGLTIDTAKLAGGAGFLVSLPGSDGNCYDDSGVKMVPGAVRYNTTTAVQPVWYLSPGSGTVTSETITQIDPWAWATADTLSYSFTVPISGWNG